MMRGDYIVEFRSEDFLADTALDWRREARNQSLPYFNIIEFVEQILQKRTKRPFKIEFFDVRPGEKRAYVKFNPRRLYVDRKTWQDAEHGEPEASLHHSTRNWPSTST